MTGYVHGTFFRILFGAEVAKSVDAVDSKSNRRNTCRFESEALGTGSTSFDVFLKSTKSRKILKTNEVTVFHGLCWSLVVYPLLGRNRGMSIRSGFIAEAKLNARQIETAEAEESLLKAAMEAACILKSPKGSQVLARYVLPSDKEDRSKLLVYTRRSLWREARGRKRDAAKKLLSQGI